MTRLRYRIILTLFTLLTLGISSSGWGQSVSSVNGIAARDLDNLTWRMLWGVRFNQIDDVGLRPALHTPFLAVYAVPAVCIDAGCSGLTAQRQTATGLAEHSFTHGFPAIVGHVWDGSRFNRMVSARDMVEHNTSSCMGCSSSGSMLFGNGVWVADTGSPAQGRDLLNRHLVSAANTAIVFHITVPSSRRGLIYSVSARCSAGTSGITIVETPTTIFSTAPTEVGLMNYTRDWATPLTIHSSTNITLDSCGVGNTGTLIIQAAIQ